ncbi:MAG: hypothetical protein FJ296_01830 [Planctomycetes bacterium]|nr:hypothetical protein [Planctomycetota bacterium]
MSLATGLLLLVAGGAGGQEAPAPAESPWYLERGTQPRTPGPLDPVPDTAQRLALLLRDGAVPGFYDGQFAVVRERFDELVRLARDPDLNHVLRVMAVMALQEAGSGAAVAGVLEPLVLPARTEVEIEYRAYELGGTVDDPGFLEEVRRADLSQHARFALAKDGQPRRVQEKIAELESRIQRWMPDILDPTLDSDRFPNLAYRRQVVFDIGYHFQQFDDFANAARWFRLLTDALPGHRETRWAHYNLACIAALQQRSDEALAHLEAAWAVGFSDVRWLLEDGDLASLRGQPGFLDLVGRMRGLPPGDRATGAPEPSGP